MNTVLQFVKTRSVSTILDTSAHGQWEMRGSSRGWRSLINRRPVQLPQRQESGARWPHLVEALVTVGTPVALVSVMSL